MVTSSKTYSKLFLTPSGSTPKRVDLTSAAGSGQPASPAADATFFHPVDQMTPHHGLDSDRDRSYIVSGNVPEIQEQMAVELDEAFYGDLTPRAHSPVEIASSPSNASLNSVILHMEEAHGEIDDIFNTAKREDSDEDFFYDYSSTNPSQLPSRRPSASSFVSIISGIVTREGYDSNEFMRFNDPQSKEEALWHQAPLRPRLHPNGLFRAQENVDTGATRLDKAFHIVRDFYKQKTRETEILEEDLNSGAAAAFLETPRIVSVLANGQYSRSESRRDSLRRLI
ncbi:unnamed protein product [Oikopleura dioica]|uniref:Uncharacterized protein n=1 Tax=Oikopleura dioica TaxID=34765 RepID=E4XMF8_OIKDI|nr:unnamed protein product [Oikopleura dioica]